MAKAKRRIPFAYYKEAWNPKNGNPDELCAMAEKIIPTEYHPDMDGKIFCPACFTNLNRVPKEKELFSNQRESFFSHQKRWQHVKCDLRASKPKGKRYDSWEEARRAVENKELIIISGFVQEEPQIDDNPLPNDFDEKPVEDQAGPLAPAPLARHIGKELELPSKITSVMGICRNFDEHLLKYYQLPDRRYPMRLVDLLHDLRGVTDTDDVPKLYYGVIKSSQNMGKTPNNIRMTWLECHPRAKDFCIKTIDRVASRKGIQAGKDSNGRIILIYGKIVNNGIGLSINQPSWGEYALLPEKYNGVLL